MIGPRSGYNGVVDQQEVVLYQCNISFQCTDCIPLTFASSANHSLLMDKEILPKPSGNLIAFFLLQASNGGIRQRDHFIGNIAVLGLQTSRIPFAGLTVV